MTKQECQACGQRAQHGLTICKKCETRTRQELGNMAAYEDDLETTLTRQVRMAAPSDGGKSAETPLPYDLTASEALSQMKVVLVSWAKLVHDEIDQTWPRRDTVRSIALHIESRMGDLRKHEAAGELVGEISELVSAVHRAIDYPEDRHKVHVGQCPEVRGDEVCIGELWLRIPFEKEGRPRVQCEGCGSVWYSERFHRLGLRIPMDAGGVQRLAQAVAGT